MICLQATEEQMHDAGDALWKEGELRSKAFIDSDFPDDFGWTAIAFPPMEKAQGRKLFGQLRLA